jgi:quinolinate synthase
MSRYARETDMGEIIVGTDTGMIHKLQKENPDKTFLPLSEAFICADMKRTTIDKVLFSLENMTYAVDVPKEISVRARKGIERMLAASR